MTRLEYLRRQRGWTQIDLAYHARVTNAEISRIERRQAMPYPGPAARLAQTLGVCANELLDEVGGDVAGGGLEVRSWRR